MAEAFIEITEAVRRATHDDRCFRKSFKHTRDKSKMVLFGMMRDDKLNLAHASPLRHQFIGLGWFVRIQRDRFFAPFFHLLFCI